MDHQNRFLIAAILSVLVLVVYQKFFFTPNVYRAQQKEAQKQEYNRIITVSSKDQPIHQPAKSAEPEKVAILENQVLKIEITNSGARLKQVWLKNFKDLTTNKPTALLNPETIKEAHAGPLLLEDLFLENTASPHWELVEKDSNHVKYMLKNTNAPLVEKEIFFHNSNYGIGLRLNIKNNTITPLPAKYKLLGGSALLVKPGIDERFLRADAKIGQDIRRLEIRKNQKDNSKIYYESPSWLSLCGRYFSLAIEPKQQEQTYFVEKEGGRGMRSGIIIGPITIKPNDTVSKEFLLYAGPNSIEEVKKVSPNMEDIVSYGKLNAISLVLLKLLKFFNRIFHNYGISIMIVTLFINVILFPLTTKSLKSIKEMQAISPEVEKLRVQYKNNPQKQQKEIMELYKKHKINPFGGCLPMFFQFPIFIALYLVLVKSIELKGAAFLWIRDLSEPDAAFKLSSTQHINILPILVAIAMLLQQRLTQPGSAQTEQQRIMGIAMPIIVGIGCYNLPAGFALYWLTSTVIMVLIQEFILKGIHAIPSAG